MGDKNWLADIKDVNRLVELLPKESYDLEVLKGYAHCDFVWGLEAAKIIHPRVVEFFNGQLEQVGKDRIKNLFDE